MHDGPARSLLTLKFMDVWDPTCGPFIRNRLLSPIRAVPCSSFTIDSKSRLHQVQRRALWLVLTAMEAIFVRDPFMSIS